MVEGILLTYGHKALSELIMLHTGVVLGFLILLCRDITNLWTR